MLGITLIPLDPTQSSPVSVERIIFSANNGRGQIAQQNAAMPITPGVYAVKEISGIKIKVLEGKKDLTDFQW